MGFMKSSVSLQAVLRFGMLVLLIASPVVQARRLLDMQDLRPTLQGSQPKADDAALVAEEAAFEKDMVGTKQILEGGGQEVSAASLEVDAAEAVAPAAAVADAVVAPAAAVGEAAVAPVEAVVADGVVIPEAAVTDAVVAPAAADTDAVTDAVIAPAAAVEEAAVESTGADASAALGEEAGLEDDAYWEWEDWDMPDKGSTFYDEQEEEMDNGWTWDDPNDLDGDNLWDEDWVAPEVDASVSGRVNATWNALMTHVAPQVSTSTQASKQLVRQGLSQVIGIEDHPRNDALLETLTFLPLMPPLLLIIFLIRAATHTLTMYNLVQFACLFCAGYSGLLITAALLTGDDPLAAFQFMAGHGPYIKYQFLVASAYCLFLMLLYVNVCVQRCGGTALMQQVLGTSVGLHYYLGTFHLAMVAMPPESVVGVPVGVPTYVMYLCIFILMAVLPSRNKEVREEAEDDKTIGEGKGQD
mmetsp:Transcript_16913/g.28559  ORF Transcript_16913/g.28559 Transcript_16913/m.28559 type:complete len:470 (-) Transcript_16913:412-1821(-)|eukprot:CAMPEP_0198213022 /NCGR_PEP_ID=MMETSP1445-20131203/28630_1 /TAXON_ID=36898 /ORGANISM="Pyramimonas sp., Strain CCMP2087" /LENGTH=469 /DNA_ID=CAMNT_0043887611 /DNA_START=263 /DNA_END=1672 /DNA_ORIENTATION=+